MNRFSSERGFTLIEILTVLLIIGALSAVFFANFGTARESAKNKAITTDLKGMQLALELYKAQNGQYPDIPPTTSCGTVSGTERQAQSRTCNTTDIIVGMTPDFIDQVIHHSKSGNPNCNMVYMVDQSFSYYKLYAQDCFAGAATAADGVQPDDEFARCPSSCADCSGNLMNAAYITSPSFYNSYAVYSSGGQCR